MSVDLPCPVCCGFAGDKAAVEHCGEGISTSRTCEIGLSLHGGIDYHGLVYLVDRLTQPRAI